MLNAGGCPSLHGEGKRAHVSDSIDIGITGPKAVPTHAREAWRWGERDTRDEEEGLVSIVQLSFTQPPRREVNMSVKVKPCACRIARVRVFG